MSQLARVVMLGAYIQKVLVYNPDVIIKSECFMISLSPCRQMLGQYFNLCHHNFLPCSSPYIIPYLPIIAHSVD
jgi:hypothetical protein